MEKFRFSAIHYNYVPTSRGRPTSLWLTVGGLLPETLYIGAVLTLTVKPISMVQRNGVAQLFSGVRVRVMDIVGKRVRVEWPTSMGTRRAQGLSPYFGESFGLYVAGTAKFRRKRTWSSVPESSLYEPAYLPGKRSTRNPLGLLL